MHFLEQAVFNSYVIHENLGGKKRFLWYKPADMQVTLNHQRIEENWGRHFPHLIPQTEKKKNHKKKILALL